MNRPIDFNESRIFARTEIAGSPDCDPLLGRFVSADAVDGASPNIPSVRPCCAF
jgi:hypothetical protein